MPPMKNGRSRRRFERAYVERRLRAVFLRCPELSRKDIRVNNLSELGLGIETSGIETPPPEGTVLSAHLVVGKTEAPIRIRLIHRNGPLTGAEFIEPSEILRCAIRAYFEPELAGASLKPVSAATRPRPGPAAELTTLRYEGAGGNSLELSVSEGKLRSLRIALLGNEVEWSEEGRLLMVQNSVSTPLSEYVRSQLVKFVQSADCIEPELRSKLEAALLTG